MNDKIIRYSMQLSMLTKLLNLSLISSDEYTKILDGLKKDYNIISNLVAS